MFILDAQFRVSVCITDESECWSLRLSVGSSLLRLLEFCMIQTHSYKLMVMGHN
jgi:hypothetical protein